jgi:hypothetical protein
MLKPAIVGVALAASLLFVEAVQSQAVPRQAAPRTVQGARVPTAPALPSINLPPLTVPQRTTIARQLSGSGTTTAGTTQRYGGAGSVPEGGVLRFVNASMVVDGEGALFNASSSGGEVWITLLQKSGSVLFDCPASNTLTWRTRLAGTTTVAEDSTPSNGGRAVFIVNLTGMHGGDVYISGVPSGWVFYHCDVTTLSG